MPLGVPLNVRLYLVRHARHADFGQRLTGRADGVPLTPEGETEARALGRRLAPAGLSEIRTSPRSRAHRTAEIIAEATGAPLTVVPALDEIDFGDWTGAEFAALAGQPLWDDWNAHRAATRPPNGESMEEAALRISAHAGDLAATRGGDAIALVTHADMIRGLVAKVLGLSLDNLLRFEIEPASVSRLEAGPWGARLLSLNETKDLTA